MSDRGDEEVIGVHVPDVPEGIRATVILADFVQSTGQKLTAVGAGWTQVVPGSAPMGVGLIIGIPWNQANVQLPWSLSLVTSDGQPVYAPGVTPQEAIQADGNLEVGRPPGTTHGDYFQVVMAINIAPLPLPVNGEFSWVLAVNGESKPHWRVSFRTVASVSPEA